MGLSFHLKFGTFLPVLSLNEMNPESEWVKERPMLRIARATFYIGETALKYMF